MKRIDTDIAIVGAGPAGLCAAIEAGRMGAKVILIDENHLVGGQLFKQIHKFFGSKDHLAGVRGFEIGNQLCNEIKEMPNVRLMLDTVAYGVFGGDHLGIFDANNSYEVHAQRYVLAAGGMENYLAFPGSTLPGVMGAGAAQTMINVHHVLPGKKVVMVGSGNVGLIVSYQLMQAGAKVEALVEAAPRVGGYGVHASKISRNGVPILTSHTVVEARGTNCIEEVVIAQVDERFKPIPGTERTIECDTLCLAVGLSPLNELAWMAGCEFVFEGSLGGHVPMHDSNMCSTNSLFYVAGDICGCEEASTAMEEGRLAGIAAAEAIGFGNPEMLREKKQTCLQHLEALRTGSFGQRRQACKDHMIQSFEKWQKEAGISHA